MLSPKKSKISDEAQPKKLDKRLPKKKSKISGESRPRTSNKRIKGKRAQKKTSRTDQSDGLEGKEASASEDVENRSDVSNAEPTISSGSDGHESGDAEQELDDAPVSQACDAEEKPDIVGKEGDSNAGQNDTEESDEEKSSSESGEKNASQTTPQDSPIPNVEKLREVNKIDKPSGTSQEECDEETQTEEVESNLKPHKSSTLDADNTDEDEPLCTWKKRVTKSQK